MAETSRPRGQVQVRVPATTANLGPGFDCLGLALDIHDTVTLTVAGGAAVILPTEGSLEQLHEALILAAAERLFEAAGRPAPALTVACDHAIPIGRGLGSSAAAIVAGMLGANALAGSPLNAEAVVALAAEMEGHPDNSTPCLLGGLQVCVLAPEGLVHLSVPAPAGLQAVLFIPDFPMPTHETRKLLPESLSRADVVFQASRVGLLVAAMATGAVEYLQTATQDRLHQPARGQVFPGMWALFEAALGAGALCAYLSGGGPTIAALTRDDGASIAEAFQRAAGANGLRGEVREARISTQGAQIIVAR